MGWLRKISGREEVIDFRWDDCSIYRGALAICGWAASPKKMTKLQAFVDGRELKGWARINMPAEGLSYPACRFEFTCLFPPGAGSDEDARISHERLKRLVLRLTYEDGSYVNMAQSKAYRLHVDENDRVGKLWHLFKQQMRSNGGTILDVGGYGPGALKAEAHDWPNKIVAIDTREGDGVDVIGDGHQLSKYFPVNTFDYVVSRYTFEHILMPWKVVVEANKVLKPGGKMFVVTHHQAGCHEVPWDFWRFTPFCWSALFNKFTGFKIEKTAEFEPTTPIKRMFDGGFHEDGWGYHHVAVLAQKVGQPTVDWPVDLREIMDTQYPGAAL
jgi:SAM-dependent methyltransferase